MRVKKTDKQTRKRRGRGGRRGRQREERGGGGREMREKELGMRKWEWRGEKEKSVKTPEHLVSFKH